ncbi:MAG: IS66 family insertion sequence element accessory protein TnpB [Gemmataceae bacterium]
MLTIPVSVRIFLYTEPTDMRKSFDALANLITEHLGQDPLSGHLFVFINRRRDRLKLLYFERGGYALWYKRLEEGSFQSLTSASEQTSNNGVEITAADFSMLLEGIDLSKAKRRKRYTKPESSSA